MLHIEQFSRAEAIRAIVEWIRSGEYSNNALEYADHLEDGSWLDYYRRKLEAEVTK